MRKHRAEPSYRRILRLPDLDHCKLAALNSLGSPPSRRVYEYSLDQLIAWFCSEPRLAFNRFEVVRVPHVPGIAASSCQHYPSTNTSSEPPHLLMMAKDADSKIEFIAKTWLRRQARSLATSNSSCSATPSLSAAAHRKCAPHPLQPVA